MQTKAVKTGVLSTWMMLGISCWAVPHAHAVALSTTITYQGELQDSGAAASGMHTFQFKLYDADSGGTELADSGSMMLNVENGRFTAPIDFGAGKFPGDARFIEITVNGEVLSPRLELTAAAHALALPGLFTKQEATETSVNVESGDLVFKTFDSGMGALVPRMSIDEATGKVAVGSAAPDPAGGELQVTGNLDLYDVTAAAGARETAATKGIRFNAATQSIEPIDEAAGLAVNTGTAPMAVSGPLDVASDLDVAGDAVVNGDLSVGTVAAFTARSSGVLGPFVYVHGDDTADAGMAICNTGGPCTWIFDDDDDGHTLKLEAPEFAVNIGGPSGEAMRIDSSRKVGIGTSAPAGDLHVLDDGGGTQIFVDSYRDNPAGPVVRLRHARGTVGFESELLVDDELGQLTFGGHDGDALDSVSAAIISNATENWAVGAHGTDLEFRTTPNGSTVATRVMTIAHDGNVAIGGGDPGTRRLQVQDGSPGPEMVRFSTSANLSSGDQVLELQVGGSSSDSMQFINCERGGGNTVFMVEGDGRATANGHTCVGDNCIIFSAMMHVGSGPDSVDPGDVMVIDVENPESTVKSSGARSTLVAGICTESAGFLASNRGYDELRRAASAADPSLAAYGRDRANADPDTELSVIEMARMIGEVPMATMGIVDCNVSAENGAIRPGDLLVTSSTPGHAMRDDAPKPGTILGKALGSLDSGTGTIRILVTLQ